MLPNDVVGFHLEPTNICTLKCPGCARTRFIDQWPQHWKNHSINLDQLHEFLDIDLNNKTVMLCGNYGDPIYHPEFHELVKGLKQRRTHLTIITNGSYRPADWWETTVSMLDANDSVTFSVDGLPENFTKYRVNADWDTIHQAMQISVAAECKTVWKYIPFAFNQHTIEQARELSTDIGIDEFSVCHSDRFNEFTMHLKPDEHLVGARHQAHQQGSWKQQPHLANINARCNSNNQHYISAAGFYSPCCDVADHRFYYKTIFGKNQKQHSIADTTLTALLDQPTVISFYQTLPEHSVCQFNCPVT